MDENNLWYDQLDRLIEHQGLSRSQVARRADVKTKTIASWVHGDVQSPRKWQPLAHVLHAVHASTADANNILQGAGHPPVHQLATHATDQERALLTHWLQSDVPFMPPDRLVTTLVGRQTELKQAKEMLRQQNRCVLLGMGALAKRHWLLNWHTSYDMSTQTAFFGAICERPFPMPFSKVGDTLVTSRWSD